MHDKDTLIELPHKLPTDEFIIIYCINRGLQFSLSHKKRYNGWLIDIVDIEKVEEDIYCSHDLFIDISLEKSGRYKVLDLDEFHYAFSIGVLSAEQYNKAMNSLVGIIDLLNRDEFPLEWLEDLVHKYSAIK